jgi:hypothetical protein
MPLRRTWHCPAQAAVEIKGSGWVVKSLEAALWEFHGTN